MANGNGKKTGAQLKREIDEVLAAPSRSGVPSQSEYERRERSEAQKRLTEIQRQPLADRKEAQAAFLKAMRDYPALIAERLGWLIDGNYGYGAMLLAKEVLGKPRMNRSAALTQMIGAFEWMTPEDMTRAAWNKLSTAEKAKLEKVIQAAIRQAENA